MKRMLFAFLLVPVFLFGQNKRIVFVESGVSLFEPIEKTENTIINLNWCGTPPVLTFTTNLSATYNSSSSFFIKIGFEQEVFRKNSFYLSLPLILGQRELKNEVRFDYGTSKYPTMVLNTNQFFSFVFGPKINYSLKKFSVFSALYFNSELRYNSKTTNTFNYQSNQESQFSVGNANRLFFNLSLQNGIIYNINSKFGIGLTCDVFFYNVNSNFNGYDQNNKHLFNLNNEFYLNNFGQYTPHIASTIINTGIRIEYKFNKIKWPIIPIPDNLK